MYGDIECADLISLFKVNSQVFGWHVKNLYRGNIFPENIIWSLNYILMILMSSHCLSWDAKWPDSVASSHMPVL